MADSGYMRRIRARSERRAGVAAVLFFAAAVTLPGVSLATESLGTVTALRGTAGSSEPFFEQPRTLGPSDPVFVHSLITTGPGSGMKAFLKDGSLIVIGAKAKMKIDSFSMNFELAERKGKLLMASGKARVIASGAFAGDSSIEVVTPVAVIGVRSGHIGVEVGMISSQKVARISVFDGTAYIRPGGEESNEVLLEAGFMATAKEGGVVEDIQALTPGFVSKFVSDVSADDCVPQDAEMLVKMLPGQGPGSRYNPEDREGLSARKTEAKEAPGGLAENFVDREFAAERQRRGAVPALQPLNQEPLQAVPTDVNVTVQLPR